MDVRALRLEQIRVDLAAGQQMVELQSRRHLAVFAVAATTAATSLAAAALGHARWEPAAGVTLLAGLVMAGQIREIGRSAATIATGSRNAKAAIERLMELEKETHVDA